MARSARSEESALRRSCTWCGLIDLWPAYERTDRLYPPKELPTLIVWGERDPLIPVLHARAAYARIPGSRLEIFPAAGHFPYRDDPQRFAALVLDFVQTTKPMPLDESRWRDRLRAGTHSTAAS
jgi:pimeloyl-ACP methyl ester carboxylesterase